MTKLFARNDRPLIIHSFAPPKKNETREEAFPVPLIDFHLNQLRLWVEEERKKRFPMRSTPSFSVFIYYSIWQRRQEQEIFLLLYDYATLRKTSYRRGKSFPLFIHFD